MSPENDSIQLIPLRIPAWWAVIYNQFYDVLPVKSATDDSIENWHYFTSRLLNIHVMDQRTATVDLNHTLFIDVGWKNESNINSGYIASLVYTHKKKDIIWEEIQIFQSTDRLAIAATIEQWMEGVNITDPFFMAENHIKNNMQP